MTYTWQQLEAMQRANPDLHLVPDAGSNVTPTPAALQVAQAGKWTEHEFQAAVIAACDERAVTDPRWGLLAAIPNGQYRHGQRMEPGLRPGYPDLFLACPGGAHSQQHGLFIELKIKPNRPRTNQMEWMQRLRQRGYACVVCYDTVEAVIQAIESYLGEP